jgi:hypothetical protein
VNPLLFCNAIEHPSNGIDIGAPLALAAAGLCALSSPAV